MSDVAIGAIITGVVTIIVALITSRYERSKSKYALEASRIKEEAEFARLKQDIQADLWSNAQKEIDSLRGELESVRQSLSLERERFRIAREESIRREEYLMRIVRDFRFGLEILYRQMRQEGITPAWFPPEELNGWANLLDDFRHDEELPPE